jgi:hypothetical protein
VASGSAATGSAGAASGASGTSSGSGTGAGSGMGSGAGTGTASGSGSGVPEGGAEGGAFACPTVTTPGTCAPPADIRCPYPKLSQTGCVDPTNPLKLASIVLPYEVNSPLWSDGALKTRGMRIPTGGKIHVKNCTTNPTECCVQDPITFAGCVMPPADDGKWLFPVGTVMVKNFMFPDMSQASRVKFVETRLFIHLPDNTPKATCRANGTDCWIGYGYQWNDAQTEATVTSDAVVDTEVTATFHVMPTAGAAMTPLTWTYPSRLECVTCHTTITPTGGGTLGPETIQMNRIATGDTMNQIDKFAAMSLFDTPPAKPYDAPLVAPYAGQAGTPPASATTEERARSYLHANCSFCHRPDGVWNPMDLRYNTPLKNAGICNVMPGKGDQGVTGALLMTPGSHATSVVWLRMTAPPGNATTGKTGRMPAIGSNVVDMAGTTLIANWIDTTATCP